MRRTRLWVQLLGVRGVIVGGIEVEEDDDGEIAGLIVSARLRKAEAGRCGVCRRRSGQYRGPGPRRWRALDLGIIPRTSKPRCRGSAARTTAWLSARCHGTVGRATTRMPALVRQQYQTSDRGERDRGGGAGCERARWPRVGHAQALRRRGLEDLVVLVSVSSTPPPRTRCAGDLNRWHCRNQSIGSSSHTPARITVRPVNSATPFHSWIRSGTSWMYTKPGTDCGSFPDACAYR